VRSTRMATPPTAGCPTSFGRRGGKRLAAARSTLRLAKGVACLALRGGVVAPLGRLNGFRSWDSHWIFGIGAACATARLSGRVEANGGAKPGTRGTVESERGVHNAKKATAAVTRYGCRRVILRGV
jgi:hypothetical protein